MKFNFFWGFFYSFLAIVSLLVIPSLLLNKEYKKIIIFALILLFLIIIAFFLQVFFAKSATSFSILNNTIVFNYYNGNTKTIEIVDVNKIKVSTYRYIFILKNGHKCFSSRVTTLFNLEKNIDPRIYEISHRFGIDIT